MSYCAGFTRFNLDYLYYSIHLVTNILIFSFYFASEYYLEMYRVFHCSIYNYVEQISLVVLQATYVE